MEPKISSSNRLESNAICRPQVWEGLELFDKFLYTNFFCMYTGQTQIPCSLVDVDRSLRIFPSPKMEFDGRRVPIAQMRRNAGDEVGPRFQRVLVVKTISRKGGELKSAIMLGPSNGNLCSYEVEDGLRDVTICRRVASKMIQSGDSARLNKVVVGIDEERLQPVKESVFCESIQTHGPKAAARPLGQTLCERSPVPRIVLATSQVEKHAPEDEPLRARQLRTLAQSRWL